MQKRRCTLTNPCLLGGGGGVVGFAGSLLFVCVWSYARPYVHDGLFGLSHVRNDAVCDDEQHEVLGAVLHRRRIPADSQEESS